MPYEKMSWEKYLFIYVYIYLVMVICNLFLEHLATIDVGIYLRFLCKRVAFCAFHILVGFLQILNTKMV